MGFVFPALHAVDSCTVNDVTRVLAAVAGAEARGDDPTAAALEAVGWANANEVVGRLITDGLLDGVSDRAPDGSVQTVLVRMLSVAGRERLFDEVSGSLSLPSRSALVAIGNRPGSTTEAANTSPPALDELFTYGLALPGPPPSLTPLGTAILARVDFLQNTGNVTIFGDVSGSQVAGAGGVITGSASVVGGADQLADIITELLTQLSSLPLSPDEAAEVRADLETARTQLLAPKPRWNVIRECLGTARAVLEGVAGNGAYAGLISLLHQLHL